MTAPSLLAVVLVAGAPGSDSAEEIRAAIEDAAHVFVVPESLVRAVIAQASSGEMNEAVATF